MLFAIFCYDDENVTFGWSKEKDAEVIARLDAVQARLAAEKRLGPVGRLMPTNTAKTIRKAKQPIVTDGPFAETKEQLLGFFFIEAADMEHALEAAKELARASGSQGAYEVRPMMLFRPGGPIG
jgi:hypothetical protein